MNYESLPEGKSPLYKSPNTTIKPHETTSFLWLSYGVSHQPHRLDHFVQTLQPIRGRCAALQGPSGIPPFLRGHGTEAVS